MEREKGEREGGEGGGKESERRRRSGVKREGRGRG